jgi:hypothetical protein
MERILLRAQIYFVMSLCAFGVVVRSNYGMDCWGFGVGFLVSSSALYLGACCRPRPREREPWDHADSFRIGPPPEVPADPARRLPSGASGRAR